MCGGEAVVEEGGFGGAAECVEEEVGVLTGFVDLVVVDVGGVGGWEKWHCGGGGVGSMSLVGFGGVRSMRIVGATEGNRQG